MWGLDWQTIASSLHRPWVFYSPGEKSETERPYNPVGHLCVEKKGYFKSDLYNILPFVAQMHSNQLEFEPIILYPLRAFRGKEG